MQDKKLVMVSTIIALLMLSMAFAPALGFFYPDGTQDAVFEIDGPHIDQILVKKYAETTPEFQALQAGEIDITDWALDATWTATFNADPTVSVDSYGGEAGYYVLNFNHNNNPYLGNPEDPLYPNPVYPNPTSVVSLRQALSYFVDRVALCAGPGEGLYDPIFTPMPAYMAYWVHPEIRYGGALDALTYNPNSVPDKYVTAAALLDADGFHMGGAGGKRYWDQNDNNVYDGTSEDFNLIIYTRADKLRKGGGDFLCAGLDNAAIQVPYTRYEVTGGQAWQTVMVDKIYNMYTSGWIFIGPDPDYLYDLYHWDNYYHPEDPPNFGAIGKHDPILSDALYALKYATSTADALTACLAAQVQFAATACEITLGSTAGAKAYKKYYTGGNNGVIVGADPEDVYRKHMWTHLVNEKGQGENSAWSTLNAYPTNQEYPLDSEDDVGYYYGDGNMVMRYGWKDNTMPQTLNPMYSSWYWESELWGRCFDGGGARDPYTKGPVQVPQLYQNWTVGTWVDPADGITKAKIRIILQPYNVWADGVPITVDDVIYTFIEMPFDLRAVGCPDVWWQPTVDQIAGFYRIDWQTVDILMRTAAVWSMNQVVGNVVIPKHLWEPYIATHTVAEISGDFSNRDIYMLTGSGPFIYVENTASTALLRRNPLYCHTIQNVAKAWIHEYGAPYSYAQGITTTAVAPSTQISPAKILDVAGTGYVHVTVPVTNLNQKLSNFEHIIIALRKFDGTLMQILNETDYNFAPGETHYWNFNLQIPKGFYKIEVVISIIGGPKYDYVHAMIPVPLWGIYLGPATFGWVFAVTVPGDLNEDFVVNIFDIVPIALAFGTQIGGVGYNPSADLNHDGLINIFDIVLVALYFGWDP